MTIGLLPESWRAVIEPVLATPPLLRLDALLRAEEAAGKTIYPARENWLTALELTPPEAVKVVILGQDPYHGPGQAQGLAFSVPPGVRVPPSLANIHKELAADIALPRPPHGNLENWAREGVLLLNAALSVEAGQAGSHLGRGWEVLTDAVLSAVAERPAPVVFMLWGGPAKAQAARTPAIAGGRHLVLTAPHPSPLSAYRGFLGCRHFSQANAFLTANGRGAIDWSL